MNNLALRVKNLRLEKQFSQTQLADKLGISYMNIANIETGRVTNPRYLSKLAEALETTTSFLLDGKKSNKVVVDAPIHLASLSDKVKLDPNKDYWVIEIDKKEQLFLTENAKKVAKIRQIFNEQSSSK